MSEMKDGGPAFPTPDEGDCIVQHHGMSLRDWFAGQVLYAACRLDGIDYRGDGTEPDLDKDCEERRLAMAQACYRYADAMLKVRQAK